MALQLMARLTGVETMRKVQLDIDDDHSRRLGARIWSA
jgi:hypothetical protein